MTALQAEKRLTSDRADGIVKLSRHPSRRHYWLRYRRCRKASLQSVPHRSSTARTNAFLADPVALKLAHPVVIVLEIAAGETDSGGNDFGSRQERSLIRNITNALARAAFLDQLSGSLGSLGKVRS
ncbi:hypothetical protein ACE10Z_35295 [Bradyrhizobium sp. Pha-3]|uniref:hypothetical protein n=1 Tax=Bradyrhizobium sp. Pha-3 TaxID=208375 RepID=UPI0035D45AF3